MAWLYVQRQEHLQKDIEDTLTKYQDIHDKLDESIKNRRKSVNDRAARCQLLIEQINKMKDEMKIDAAQMDQMRQNISKDEEVRNEINRRLQKIQRKTDILVKNIAQLENDMAESSES